MDRYIIFELDKVTKLSAIDYVPRQDANNGRFTSCEVYISLDGESWTLAGSGEGWAVDKSTKTIVFDEALDAKYVKVVGTAAYGNFGSAAMINFYESLSYTLGDVNTDGKVNLFDALLIARYNLQFEELTDAALLAGDVNGDSTVNLADAILVQMYVTKIDVNYPIGSVVG